MTSGITLSKSDRANGTIFVADNSKNSDSASLTFIGKNAPSFGVAVNQDFLYLLENFANATPPVNPIQGQLWYDTSDSNQTGYKLKVKVSQDQWWRPVNGIWQQDGYPEAPDRGDVWVDTSRNQVFIRTGLSGTGTNWTLVGPTYSSVLKTGSYADTIADNKGGTHQVIKNYIDDAVVEVIASADFYPQPPIPGFSNGLHAGVNLSSLYNGKLNATAVTADALNLANGTTVTGDNLVKTNVDSIVNATLSVNVLQVGQSSSNGTTTPWSISQSSLGTDAKLINPIAGGSFIFQATSPDIQGSLPVSIVTINSNGLGINRTTPSTGLDVNGPAAVSKTLTLTTTGNAIVSSGSVSINRNLTVSGNSVLNNVTSTGVLYIGSTSETAHRSAVLPNTLGSAAPDIGGLNNRFGTVYAQTFDGTLTGDVRGGATKLLTSSTFRVSGQVSSAGFNFDGSASTTYNFVSVLTNAAITAQTTTTSVDTNDKILIAKASDPSTLYQISKGNLLQAEAKYLVPTGAIIPYAGPANKVPSGWLLCDGSLVDQGYFNDLFTVIKYTYGKGSVPSQFRIPDLRSRVAMGYDDMSNVNTAFGQAALDPAAPTAGAFRTTQNSPDYAQSYELGLQGPVTGEITGVTYSTSTSVTIDTALHFHGLNYIIKT